MKLVIAEKPSVAQSLAAVIGATVRKDGYLEGNGWRVSWCVGHLAGLADADSYDPKYAKWRYDDLPILPEHWQMVVGKDKKKQFDILKKLMNAPDVTEVVNACDPHSAAYASEHGEMAQYNLSYQANSACKEAIEQTISAHYAESRLDTEAAVKDVLEKFGTERVQFILANTIQRKNYDGRISQDNKAWAKTIPMLEDSGASRHCAYLVVDQVNPGLTDLFTRQFRKVAQEQQKSSVLQKLKQELPAHKSAAPKKREPER